MDLHDLEKIADETSMGAWSTGIKSVRSIEGYIASTVDQRTAEYIATFNPARVEKLLAVVRAAQSVIDSVNPMFCETDECLMKLREALEVLEENP